MEMRAVLENLEKGVIIKAGAGRLVAAALLAGMMAAAFGMPALAIMPGVIAKAPDALTANTAFRPASWSAATAWGTFYPSSEIARSEVAAILTRIVRSSARKPVTLS